MKHLKKLDMHSKVVEGVNQQTLLGACLTVITSVVVMVLIFSEISLFLQVDTVSRMVADTTASKESIILHADIEIFNYRCDQISFYQEVTRGQIHIIDSSTEDAQIMKHRLNADSDIGCSIIADIVTDKIAGNFRFAVEKPSDDKVMNYNLSHRINLVKISPGVGAEKIDESKIDFVNPLSNKLMETDDKSAGIHHYNLQVVPTQYKTLYGSLSFANQFAVAEKSINVGILRHNDQVGGVALLDFRGLIFTYDFNPVMLYMEERRERIIDFVSNLFGIVGGTITVFAMFERFLHHSTKSFIGKKD